MRTSGPGGRCIKAILSANDECAPEVPLNAVFGPEAIKRMGGNPWGDGGAPKRSKAKPQEKETSPLKNLLTENVVLDCFSSSECELDILTKSPPTLEVSTPAKRSAPIARVIDSSSDCEIEIT